MVPRMRTAAGFVGSGGRYGKAVFLHYPPVYPVGGRRGSGGAPAGTRRETLLYGHLHGPSIPRAVQGELDGISTNSSVPTHCGFFPYKI